MNKIILSGNLTKDPEQIKSETPCTKFSIGVNRTVKKEGAPSADFFNITTFGKVAENSLKFLSRGKRVTICGVLQNTEYTDKDGNKIYGTAIIANEVDFN